MDDGPVEFVQILYVGCTALLIAGLIFGVMHLGEADDRLTRCEEYGAEHYAHVDVSVSELNDFAFAANHRGDVEQLAAYAGALETRGERGRHAAEGVRCNYGRGGVGCAATFYGARLLDTLAGSVVPDDVPVRAQINSFRTGEGTFAPLDDGACSDPR